jgi:hypothetical protein
LRTPISSGGSSGKSRGPRRAKPGGVERRSRTAIALTRPVISYPSAGLGLGENRLVRRSFDARSFSA